MKLDKATITVKQGRHTFVQSFAADRKGILTFARDCKKVMRGKVLVHFQSELYPVEIR